MNAATNIATGGVAFVALIVFGLMCHKKGRGQTREGSLVFVVLGMLMAMLGGFLIFLRLGTFRGWNPYGWWLLCTFFATVSGGLLGLIVYGFFAGKAPDD